MQSFVNFFVETVYVISVEMQKHLRIFLEWANKDCNEFHTFCVRDCLQTSPLIWSKFKRIFKFCYLKWLENRRFFNDFKGNRSYLICLNLLNIRSEIWRWSVKPFLELTLKLRQQHTKILYPSVFWCRQKFYTLFKVSKQDILRVILSS